MPKHDTVLRWIDTLSALIARILRGDRSASLELARQHLDDAKAMTLGPLHTLAPHLEPAQLAELLNDPHRIYGYARILAFEAALTRAAGSPATADQLTRQALALADAAIARITPVPPEWAEWTAECRAPSAERRERAT